MDPTIESLKREVAILREKLNDTEKKLEIKEAQLRTFIRTATPFTPRTVEMVVEMRLEMPKSIKRGRESTNFGVGEGRGKRFEGGGIPFDPEGLRGKRTVVGVKVNVVLWEVSVEGLLAALEEKGYVICEGARWLVDEEEVVRRKSVHKTSSTVVVFVCGALEVAGLLRRGLWLGGRWHSVKRFEAVQLVRKKSGWVWMREWMEKEGKVRDERGRKARVDIESINEQLRELRKSTKKLENKEKRRRYEGVKEVRPVKPVSGLVLKKDMKGKEAEREFDSEAGVFW